MEGFFTFREISRLFWENFGPERSEGPKFSQKSREISRKVKNLDNFRFFIKAHFQNRYKRNFVSMDPQLSVLMVQNLNDKLIIIYLINVDPPIEMFRRFVGTKC